MQSTNLVSTLTFNVRRALCYPLLFYCGQSVRCLPFFLLTPASPIRHNIFVASWWFQSLISYGIPTGSPDATTFPHAFHYCINQWSESTPESCCLWHKKSALNVKARVRCYITMTQTTNITLGLRKRPPLFLLTFTRCIREKYLKHLTYQPESTYRCRCLSILQPGLWERPRLFTL